MAQQNNQQPNVTVIPDTGPQPAQPENAVPVSLVYAESNCTPHQLYQLFTQMLAFSYISKFVQNKQVYVAKCAPQFTTIIIINNCSI